MAQRGRPKSAKPAPKPISEDELEERKHLDDEDLDEDEDEEDENEDEDEDDDVLPVRGLQRNMVPQVAPTEDIFDFCEVNYIQKGVPVSFIVNKNGTLIGELQFPLSWSALQKEWGGGLYTVRAKNCNTKKFLKVQTMTIAQPPNANKKEEPQMQEKIVERFVDREPQEPKMNFLEMLQFMKGIQGDAGEKVREAQKEARDSQTTLMAAMMQMMAQTSKPTQSSDDKIMQLMMQMQQNTNQMFEKVMMMTRESISEVSKSSEKIFEKLSQRIEALADNKKGNGLEYTPQQVMEMMMQSQQRGFEMWSHTERMAELKASQKLEILEATKGEAAEEARPKSLTEKLVDSMLPAVAQVISAQVAAQNRSQVPAAPAKPALPAPKRPAQAAPQRPAPARPATKPAPQRPAPTKPASPPAPAKPVEPEVLLASETVESVAADPFGFPSAAPVQATITETVEAAPEAHDEEKFNSYMNVAAQSLMTSFQSQKPIPDTTNALVSSLQAQGIEASDFLSVCPKSKVDETLQAFGADETIMNFVGEVYAYLEAGTAMGVRG